MVGINLRWNVSLSSFPCQATRDGKEEEAPTPQNPPTKAAVATKRGRRGLRVFFKGLRFCAASRPRVRREILQGSAGKCLPA